MKYCRSTKFLIVSYFGPKLVPMKVNHRAADAPLMLPAVTQGGAEPCYAALCMPVQGCNLVAAIEKAVLFFDQRTTTLISGQFGPYARQPQL